MELEEELEDAVLGDPEEKAELDAVVKLRGAPRGAYARANAKKSVTNRKSGKSDLRKPPKSSASSSSSDSEDQFGSDSNLVATVTLPSPSMPLSDQRPYVMLSYSWSTKELVKQVQHAIVQVGVKVWFDEDEMRGSLIDRMAEAVEGASAIVLCYSHAYKNSSSCRGEAQYAYKCRKPVIPVRCQESYDADGWLGFIIGSMLYYDISTADSFKQNLPCILKEVVRYVRAPDRNLASIDGCTQPAALHSAPQPPPPLELTHAEPPEEYLNWTEEDVQNWLEKEQLTHMKDT